jgi:hypothetical protein
MWPESAARKAYQDESGRLWDVLWMASRAIKAAARRSTDTVLFQVYRIPVDGRGRSPKLVTLKAVCHGDDHGAPVITIMQPEES